MHAVMMNTPLLLNDSELALIMGGEWSWLEFGAATVSGAVGGAAAGAVAGVMVGGVGAAPGAGVGAISGAVGGAVSYASYQAYMYFFG